MPDNILTGIQNPATAAGVVEQASNGNSQVRDASFDTYLKLLVTQLENQDPMNPMDSTDMTAQLATFSQLEQQVASNEYLEKLTKQNDYSAQALAVSYIGKEVLAPAGVEFAPADVELKAEGDKVHFAFDLEEAASSVQVEIRNASGELVYDFDAEGFEGIHTLTWDGTNQNGDPVAAGEYRIQVKALGAEEEKIVHQLYTYEQVEAMASNGTVTTLNLKDGREVSFDSVLQVRVAEEDNS